MWLNFNNKNINQEIKTSNFGLLTKIALLVECWAPGARFSKVPRTFRVHSGWQFSLYLQNEGVSRHETWRLLQFLFRLQHVKRPVSQLKRVGILRMTFRDRKAFGTFEKRAPGQNCIACAWSNSSKKAICTSILQRLVHCCSYVR